MKFSDRSATERVAIDAWIRVTVMARENLCLDVAEDFRNTRRQDASPDDIETMLRCYATYRQGRHPVSYTDYFQVSHPVEFAAIMAYEKKHS